MKFFLKEFWPAILIFIVVISFILWIISIIIIRFVEYETIKYFQDYHTKLCFAEFDGRRSRITYVPCTPEVLEQINKTN